MSCPRCAQPVLRASYTGRLSCKSCGFKESLEETKVWVKALFALWGASTRMSPT